MQILVLGMHRSGTSAVTRLLNMMGCHLGAPASIMGANPENPKGFWENEDIKALNIEAMTAVGCRWDRVLHLDPAVFSEDRFKSLRNRMTHEVIKLDSCRPWAIKDPRMCLMTPVWRPKLELPIALLTYRPAIEIAKSLHTRNKMPLAVGLGLWEKYTIESLRNSLDMPRFLVSYPSLVENPHEAVRDMYEKLVGLGVRRLELPAPQEIEAFIESNLRRERATEDLTGQFLNRQQLRLDDAMRTGEALEWSEFPEVSGSAQEVMAWYEGFIEAGIASGDVETGKEKTVFDPHLNAERIRTLKQQVTARDEELPQLKNQVEAAKKEAEAAKKEAEAAKAAQREAGMLAAGLAAAETSLAKATTEVRRLESSLSEAQKGLRRIPELEQQLAAARKDVRYLFDVVKRLVHNMENWNRNWWWRTGMRLRLIAGKLALHRGKPRMPADIAGEVWREVRAKFEPRFAPKPAAGTTGPGLPTEIRELNSVVLLLEEWLDSILLDLAAIAGLRWFRLGCTVRKLSWAAGLRPPHPWDPVEEFETLKRNVEAWRKDKQALLSASKPDARAARGQYAEQIRQLMKWIEVGYRNAERIGNHKWWKLGLRLHRLSPGKMERPIKDAAATIAKYRQWQKTFTLDTPAIQATSPILSPALRPLLLPQRTALARTTDIVVCVHDALNDVKHCLTSVARNTPQAMNTIYIVNDGSDAETTLWLRRFAARHQAVLLESAEAQRYTKAANRGMRASSGDYVVLLNSDTIVPEGWLDRLLECAESDQAIGIVGPLSNAASYQSVPEIRSADGDWIANQLPRGLTVDDMAALIARISDRRFPEVTFINGFCYVIKRAVIERIGYFDEETFPKGYGEENDYSLRAADAGFKLAIADHAYVYHAKSKSYTDEVRRTLSGTSQQSLLKKHGEERFRTALQTMNDEHELEPLRERLRSMWAEPEHWSGAKAARPFRVLFLLLDQISGGGGSNSIVQETAALRSLGVHAEVAVAESARARTREIFPFQPPQHFFFYRCEPQLRAHAAQFDVVIATHFKTMEVLRRICAAAPSVVPGYYCQDYEPLFVPDDRPDLLKTAQESYTAHPQLTCFAKTDWIRGMIAEKHSVRVVKVNPSLDTDLYHPPAHDTRQAGVVHIVAMVRMTPNRAPRETMDLLRTIQLRYPRKVKVSIFGNNPGSAEFRAMPQDFAFENHGVLIREQVAELLKTADIFVDMSKFQGFGRTGLEAMAVGCATLLPTRGGVHEYARHRENALVVDTENMQECEAALDELVRDETLRESLARAGMVTAARYDTRSAAISELLVFQEAVRAHLVTVVVPVYNAFEETRACVDSLLAHTTFPHQVLLLDDASPDERVWPMLVEYSLEHAHVRAVQNPRNLGYTATINAGCSMAPGDVVLLNSDTLVTPRWLDKLREVAYSRENVATVTPLSNAAGAFSVPQRNVDGPLPEGMNASDMAALVERLSHRIRPEVPTGNGFCMYITRKAIQTVGLFDEENFPRGYGEENDFAMRAHRLGLVHLIDDATFVYHKGTASFKEEKADLTPGARRRLNELHPEYKPMVTEWERNDLLGPFREALQQELNRQPGPEQAASRGSLRPAPSARPTVLMIMHNGKGGTLQHVTDLLTQVSEHYVCWLLRADLQVWTLHRWQEGALHLVERTRLSREWRFGAPWDAERKKHFEHVLRTVAPDLAHVHHVLALHPDIIPMLKLRNLPILFSLHDFYVVSPTLNLVDHAGVYTAGYYADDEAEPGPCTSRWFRETRPTVREERAWRDLVGSAMSQCNDLIAPSESTRAMVQEHFEFLKHARFHVIEHGADLNGMTWCSTPPEPERPIKVVAFGAFAQNKGLPLIESMLLLNKEQGSPMEFHFLGISAPPLDAARLGCVNHGRYDRAKLNEIMAGIAPSLCIIPSLCPETYCYSMSEALAMGIPVLGSSLGAIGDRIRQHGGGWVLPPEDPQAWLNKIREIASSPDDYAARLEEVRHIPRRTVEEMGADYMDLYGHVLETEGAGDKSAATRVTGAVGSSMESVPSACVKPSGPTSSTQPDSRTPLQELVADVTAYDFFDFGPSGGNSVAFGQKYLHGGRPLGFELSPDRVKALREKGIDCVEGDILKLAFPSNITRFTLMSHFLEHLPGLDAMRAVVHEAVKASRDFLFIQGPYFDADEYLRMLGFKCYYSDWTDHRCNWKSWELLDILSSEEVAEYRFFGVRRINGSDSDIIHPLESRLDQHEYDPAKHPPKRHVEFEIPVFQEIVCCARLRDIDYFDAVLSARAQLEPIEPVPARYQ